MKQDGEPNGISRAQQAAYAAQALALAKKDPRTDMFIWFVFRDHATSLWQSGLRTTQRRREAVARALHRRGDARSTRATRSSASRAASPARPSTVPLRAYAAGTKPGEKVGFNVRVLDKGEARRERASRRRPSAATRPLGSG